MQTTRRIIWHLAIWLALAFSSLATCPPAIATCALTGQEATMAHSCCKPHPDTCACQPTTGELASQGAHSSSCGMSACPCALTPVQDTAPLPPAAVLIFSPAALGTAPLFLPVQILRRGPPIVSADITPHSLSLPPTPPRAPPFQG